MKDMQFLKENKNYFAALLLLPLVFFYLDSRVISWMRAIPKDSDLYYSLQSIDPIMDVISHGVTLAIIACVLYVTGKYISVRVTEAGKYLFIGLLSTGGIVQIVKHLFGRARPRFTNETLFIGPTFKGGYDSFPSGHTAAVFCFAYILSQYFPRYRILLYLYAVLMALERIEGCSHFPSDVLAGALLGIIIGKILLKMFKAKQLILSKK
jgi:membrane-associated phospholipid phosphatase